jgi:hypothetical protein
MAIKKQIICVIAIIISIIATANSAKLDSFT